MAKKNEKTEEVSGRLIYHLNVAKGQCGWICPICDHGVSPWLPVCPCKGPPVEILNTTTNATEWTLDTYEK